MALILKLDLDMVNMYHHTKHEVSMSWHSKVIARTDTQTGRHTHTRYENITFPYTWVVIMFHDYLRHFTRSTRKVMARMRIAHLLVWEQVRVAYAASNAPM